MNENPYLLLFLHIERYGLLNKFLNGELSYSTIEQLANRFDVSTKLLYKLACRLVNEDNYIDMMDTYTAG